MTRQPASRPRSLRVIGTAAAALTASAALLSPAASATSGHVRPATASLIAHTTATRQHRPASPRGRAPSKAVLAAEVAASARAQATGKPQVVTAATAPTSITVARPDGTFRMTMNVLPVRFKVDGRWRPVSTRLRRNRNGTWSPVLVSSPVTLSGGGTGPLAVLYSGGRRLTVSWPRPLPTPAITGSTATYRAARGLGIEVTVSSLGGISIATFASSRAALHGVRLRLGGTGLAIAASRDGAITATARSGGPVLFSGPAPSQSRAVASARPTTAAPATARRTAMTVARTHGGGLVLTARPMTSRAGQVTATVAVTPDTAGCDKNSGLWCTFKYAYDGISSQNCGSHYNAQWFGADFDGDGDAQNDSSKDNDGDFNEGQLVGQDFWGGCGTTRAFYVMNTNDLTSDMRIQTAFLHTWLSASSDATGGGPACNNDQWPLHLYDLGRGAQVNSGTTWNGTGSDAMPTLPSSAYRTDWIEPGPPGCTNPRDITFSAWDPIVNAKSNNYQYWTFALTGEENGSYNGTCGSGQNCGQMRIGDENENGTGFPYVVTTFDIVPPEPQEPAGGATLPVAYDGPPPGVVAGLNSNVEDNCAGLVVFPAGWIDTGYPSSVSLRVNMQPLDSTVSAEPQYAEYQVTDDTEGTTFAPFFSANNFSGGGLTNTVIPYKLWDGHVYSWEAWSWVNGTGGNPNISPIGGSDVYGPFTSTMLGQCTFRLDKDAPTNVNVTSTAFPVPGSGPAGKFAGEAGSFNFSAVDNPPTNCSPNPCTASSGLWGYAYSLNQSAFSPVYGTNTVLAGSDGTATVSITPGNWGINNLYVEAIDRAGNVSQAFDYTFYAPFDPTSFPTPGDVSDVGATGTAHIADLLATTGTCSSNSSGLNLYNNPGITAATWPSPTDASGSLASPDDQNDWACFDLTHRGMELQQSSGLDDLWAIKPSTGGQPGPGNLYLYQNNPASPGTDPYGNTVGITGPVLYPACASTADNANNCLNYPPNWTTVTGIVAVGDAWAGDPPATGASPCDPSNINCDYKNQASLVVADSNGTLWLYQDKGGATLGNPIQIGSGGWNNVTLLAPGQLDNGKLTLWARDDNTSDTTYGEIFAYSISLSKDGIPTLHAGNPAQLVTATSGTALPVTAPATTYPSIATPGDAGFTGGPNLYAVDTNGQVWVWPYTKDDTLSSTPVKLATVPSGTITRLF